MSWNEDRVALLKELRDAGKSNSEIARLMGISRSAVGAKLMRLGVPPKPRPLKVDKNNARRRRREALRIAKKEALKVGSEAEPQGQLSYVPEQQAPVYTDHIQLPTEEPINAPQPKDSDEGYDEIPTEETQQSQRILFVDGHDGVCRWPLWRRNTALEEKFICGAPCVGYVYCEYHAALAGQPNGRGIINRAFQLRS